MSLPAPEQGIIIVHPDWPWVFRPEQIDPPCLQTCERTLALLERQVEKAKGRTPIALVATPSKNKHNPLPSHLTTFYLAIQSSANLIITISSELEDVGEYIAKTFKEVDLWNVGGFWKDLCCADIAHGARQISRAQQPPRWSTFSELHPNLKTQ